MARLQKTNWVYSSVKEAISMAHANWKKVAVQVIVTKLMSY